MNIAIIGTYPPRQCGIATFTQDLFKSLHQDPTLAPAIIAISDGSEDFFPSEVYTSIEKNKRASYMQAARHINETFDAVIVQHEYGIFGGEAGDYILDFVRALAIPVVTNFHTVLQQPSAAELRVLQQLSAYSKNVTVMTDTAVNMLQDIYHIAPRKIELIPHGVPHFSYRQSEAKQELGLSGKRVMLSFGFLGPSKGFETAIEAVASVPNEDFIYIILGSTHPNILREAGESYREYLQTKAQDLGIGDKVCFVNEFASEELLTQYLSACDIYVTPYPNENQISSGTLSFAIGAGAAVVSTPYWYAKDLLKDDRGLLFDFKDSVALSLIIRALLDEPQLLAKYRQNAVRYGASMSWSNIGKLQSKLLRRLITKEATVPVTLPLNGVHHHINNLLHTSSQKLSS
ncbi:glycosyltransferase [Sphingobacterium sp. DK4209]|uniref:Glycosyltransferase n=1 Tax=Sphingobacterium zhuxiongii TaxID=2662364 RepID=A0A5Q0Q701_9SPHI|nr:MULTISPECIES: glycosyltransferase family 4 protein [unclassified Sphingobacterium]MVZ67574.1 glycosyltransferase [Sphingobacterium sp. DK4209]QGA24879.1 glycosyltransferase [Sphingobacterium sp. dk4302]